MKKIVFILTVTTAMIACQNNAEEEKRTADSLRIADSIRVADSIRMADSSKMRDEPAHNMSPRDTTGRRPRD